MSKSVEDTRRELFEAGINIRTLTRNEHGDYVLGEIRDMWSGFNLALDTVEIELPPQDISHYGGPDSEYGPSYEQVEGAGYNHGISDCRLSIESLNLGLKVK